LEDEGAAHGGLGEALLEVPRLPGKDDPRERLDGVEHGVQGLLARVLGELQRLLRLLAAHRPLPPRRRGRRGRGLRGGGGPVVLRRVGGMSRGDGAPLHGHERGRASGRFPRWFRRLGFQRRLIHGAATRETGGSGSSMPPLGENIDGGGGLRVDFR
jgi:hypothetical protein